MGAFGIGPMKPVYVDYDFAGGIDRGSPVRLAGIKVGRVSDIQFSGTPSVLRVRIDLTNDAFKQMTEDSKFYVNLAGLIGERYVEVVPGNGATVPRGHVFRGIDPPRIDQLISQGYGIFGDLRTLFNENKGDIKEILTQMNELSKNLNKLVGSVGPDSRKQLYQLLENFSAMSGDLRSVMSSVKGGMDYMETNGGKETWQNMRSIAGKANSIGLRDVRKLMLEDGMKVNFSSKKVEAELGK